MGKLEYIKQVAIKIRKRYFLMWWCEFYVIVYKRRLEKVDRYEQFYQCTAHLVYFHCGWQIMNYTEVLANVVFVNNVQDSCH